MHEQADIVIHSAVQKKVHRTDQLFNSRQMEKLNNCIIYNSTSNRIQSIFALNRLAREPRICIWYFVLVTRNVFDDVSELVVRKLPVYLYLLRLSIRWAEACFVFILSEKQFHFWSWLEMMKKNWFSPQKWSLAFHGLTPLSGQQKDS